MKSLLPCMVVLALLLSGCGARPASTPTEPQVVIALLDVSGSTEAVRAKYMAQVEAIVASVPAGARLVVLPVSARSLTAPTVVDITFPTYTWWKSNSFTHDRTVKKRRDEALAAVSALFEESPGSRGTALVDGLIQAQEFLKPYPEGAGALYLISDMVEQSDLLNLYDLTEAGVQPALGKVREAKRMPSLRGAAVSVAGLEASGHLPSERVLAIRSFWEQLFERAGARLQGYAPTLQPSDGPQ